MTVPREGNSRRLVDARERLRRDSVPSRPLSRYRRHGEDDPRRPPVEDDLRLNRRKNCSASKAQERDFAGNGQR